MQRTITSKSKVAFSLVFFVLLLIFIYLFKLDVLAWHWWHKINRLDHHGLNLSNYQVAIEAKPLNHYKNISGITFNHDTGTLFAVINDRGLIIELTREGKLLREITVDGTDDLEDITYIENNYYVLADERESRLWLFKIQEDTVALSTDNAKLVKLGINQRGNKNFEGVTWDWVNHHLIVVKERDPKYVLSVTGLYHPNPFKQDKIEIDYIKKYDQSIQLALRDLSAVSYHSQSGHLFLLSDESKLLKQFDETGKTLASLALWRGFHGLHQSIPQAEGVAIDDEGNIYIVSEPNLFYIFKPKNPMNDGFKNN